MFSRVVFAVLAAVALFSPASAQLGTAASVDVSTIRANAQRASTEFSALLTKCNAVCDTRKDDYIATIDQDSRAVAFQSQSDTAASLEDTNRKAKEEANYEAGELTVQRTRAVAANAEAQAERTALQEKLTQTTTAKNQATVEGRTVRAQRLASEETDFTARIAALDSEITALTAQIASLNAQIDSRNNAASQFGSWETGNRTAKETADSNLASLRTNMTNTYTTNAQVCKNGCMRYYGVGVETFGVYESSTWSDGNETEFLVARKTHIFNLAKAGCFHSQPAPGVANENASAACLAETAAARTAAQAGVAAEDSAQVGISANITLANTKKDRATATIAWKQSENIATNFDDQMLFEANQELTRLNALLTESNAREAAFNATIDAMNQRTSAVNAADTTYNTAKTLYLAWKSASSASTANAANAHAAYDGFLDEAVKDCAGQSPMSACRSGATIFDNVSQCARISLGSNRMTIRQCGKTIPTGTNFVDPTP